MSAGGSVSRRYAKALLAIGLEQGNVRALLDDAAKIAETVDGNPQLRELLRSPAVLPSQRKQVLESVLAQLGVSRIAINACLLLVDRGRGDLISAVVRELRAMVDEHDGLVRAEVAAATPLSKEYLERLRALLEAKTGKRVILAARRDEGLIAGVVTRVGDVVYDGSLRARLGRVRAQMLK